MNIVVELAIQVLSLWVRHSSAKLGPGSWPPKDAIVPSNGDAAPWVKQFYELSHEQHCDYLNGLKIGPWSLVYVVQFLGAICGVYGRHSTVMNIGNGEFYDARSLVDQGTIFLFYGRFGARESAHRAPLDAKGRE
jgi:hypothetical protein